MRKSPPMVNGRASSTILQNSALRRFLHRQLFAAAATAGSQNPAAVLGRHAGTESMHLAALTLLGLISTEHGQHSSQTKNSFRIPGIFPVPVNIFESRVRQTDCDRRYQKPCRFLTAVACVALPALKRGRSRQALIIYQNGQLLVNPFFARLFDTFPFLSSRQLYVVVCPFTIAYFQKSHPRVISTDRREWRNLARC